MGKHVRYVENIFLTPLNEDLFVGYFIYPVLYKHPTKKVSYRKIPHRLKHFYIYIYTSVAKLKLFTRLKKVQVKVYYRKLNTKRNRHLDGDNKDHTIKGHKDEKRIYGTLLDLNL